MKRFLMQNYKLKKILNASSATGSTLDTATRVSVEGADSLNVLFDCYSTTGDPTVTLNLIAGTASTGGSTTTVATASWTAGATFDFAALQTPTNVAGVDYHFYQVKLTTAGGTAKGHTLYFLGGPRKLPIAVETGTTDDPEHHATNVKSTTVAT